MKYLESESLASIADILTNFNQIGGVVLNGRLDAFTSKRVGEDKILGKSLDTQLAESNITKSNLGNMMIFANRKLFIDLIQTMNAIFPDFDFSSTSPDSFTLVPQHEAIQRVNSHLGEITLSLPNFLTNLWSAINLQVNLHDCSVYTYIGVDHPFTGSLWSFNLFFVNKDLKRICYFSCMATHKALKHTPFIIDTDCNDHDEDDDEYMEREEEPADSGDDEY